MNSLSGRFLILTTVFVMLAEILIFVPSVARFREDYLLLRLERAQIASLALLADDMIEADLEPNFWPVRACSTWCCAVTKCSQLDVDDRRCHNPSPRRLICATRRAVVLIRDAMMRLVEPEENVCARDRRPVAGGWFTDRNHDGERARCVRR